MSTPDPLDALVSAVAEAPDAVARARLAGQNMDRLGQVVTQLSSLRQASIQELVDQGMSHAAIGRELGLTRARVSQLLSAGVPPERAFLGTGPLTVAVGGKWEGGRHDGAKQPVVSAQAMAAYELLADAARALGTDSTVDVVPPPGLVDLNRINLVVLTSPRLLPLVGQVLGADPAFGFEQDAQSWYLVDKTSGNVHRPPRDSTGEPVDYAYVGRLPRPDSKGTFLYLAGVHAMGTLGAAAYLVDNLTELWRAHRTRRFSLLLAVRYDPEKLTLTNIEPLAGPHQHEGA